MIDLTPIPNRLTRPDTIDDDADAFFGKLPQYGADLIALQAALNGVAAGGAYAPSYTFDGTTSANADPGNGKLRLSGTGSSQAGSTAVYLDLIGADGADYTGLIDTMDLSTNPVKGTLFLCKTGDRTKFLFFDVTARGTATGYRSLVCTPRASSSSNPFANGDLLTVYYQRSGDMGATGSAGSVLTGILHVADIRSSGAAAPGVSAGVTTRTLNTVVRNTIGGVAALASNQVTLPAGTYRVSGSAIVYAAGATQAYLYNVTTSSTILAGTSEYSNGSTTHSDIMREIVLAAQSVIELRHWALSSTGNFGYPTGSGVGEVYAHLIFEKIA
jgi:hypothetical protein